MNIRLNMKVLVWGAIPVLAILAAYWWSISPPKPINPSSSVTLDGSTASQKPELANQDTIKTLPALHDPSEIKASINTSLTPAQSQNTGIQPGAEHEQTDEILRDVNQMNVELSQLLTQNAQISGFSTLDADAILVASKALIAQVDKEYGTDSVAFGLQWRASLEAIDDPELQGLNAQRQALDEELETIINSFE